MQKMATIMSVGLLFSFFLCTAVAQNPALKITWENSLFTELAAALTPVIENIILNSTIPQINGTLHIIWPIGNFDYWISDIQFSTANFSQNTFMAIANEGVQFQVENGVAEFNCNWKWERETGIIHPSDKGTASVTASGIGITLQVSITEVDGRPYCKATKSEVSLKKLDISVHSGLLGWIYDLFIWIFNFIVKDVVEDQMQDILSNVINNNLNKMLQEIPILIPLGPVDFNVSLPYSPTVTSESLTIPFTGGFVSSENPKPLPFQAGPLPDSCNDEMINIMIEEYMFDSLTYVLDKNGFLNITLTQDNIPNGLQQILNTTFWKLTIPNLDKYYPDSIMNIGLYPMNVPTLNLTSTGLNGQSTYSMYFYIVNGTSVSPSVLSISAGMSNDFSIFVNQTNNGTKVTKIHVDIKSAEADLSVITSSIGHVDLLLLNQGIKTILNVVVIPVLNQILGNEGIPLPQLSIFNLEEPNVLYGNGTVCISSNVSIHL